MVDINDNQPIDPKVVADLHDLMGDAYVTVYEAFIRSSEQNMADLSTAVESNALEAIQAIAHTLKGSSANVGAKHFSDISHKMMDDARNSVSADYHIQLVNLTREYEKVRESIMTFLSG